MSQLPEWFNRIYYIQHSNLIKDSKMSRFIRDLQQFSKSNQIKSNHRYIYAHRQRG